MKNFTEYSPKKSEKSQKTILDQNGGVGFDHFWWFFGTPQNRFLDPRTQNDQKAGFYRIFAMSAKWPKKSILGGVPKSGFPGGPKK